MSFSSNRHQIVSVFVLLVIGIVTLGQPQPCFGQEIKNDVATAPDPNQKRIEQLSTLLTNSRWTGRFTTVDPNGDIGNGAKETYEITKAEKLPEGDLWMLTARIKYGKRDVTVPLPIDIVWAGETPVITVNRLLIPGLGTFDARVLIRGGKYSGTWTHNDHGGHLFGKIGRMKPPSE